MSKKVLVSDVEPHIEPMNGNIAAIARKLGVSRGTVYNRISESTTLQQMLEDARETMVDNAESMLYKKVLDGDMTALIFFLKTQGKQRGYTQRQEISGPDGGPVVIINWDDADDND